MNTHGPETVTHKSAASIHPSIGSGWAPVSLDVGYAIPPAVQMELQITGAAVRSLVISLLVIFVHVVI